jgi:sulfur transfer protein SufE
MNKSEFLTALQKEAATFNSVFTTPSDEWIVKGFIDIAKNVYCGS